MPDGFVGEHGHVAALDPCEDVGGYIFDVTENDVIKRRQCIALLKMVLDKRPEASAVFVSRELFKVHAEF